MPGEGQASPSFFISDFKLRDPRAKPGGDELEYSAF